MLKFHGRQEVNSPTSQNFIISYVIGRSWQLRGDDGCIYTPQSYEAEFGCLPQPPKTTRKRRKEWYAHRRKAKKLQKNKGFKPKNIQNNSPR